MLRLPKASLREQVRKASKDEAQHHVHHAAVRVSHYPTCCAEEASFICEDSSLRCARTQVRKTSGDKAQASITRTAQPYASRITCKLSWQAGQPAHGKASMDLMF